MNPCVLWDKDEKMFKMWYAAGEQFEPDVLAMRKVKTALTGKGMQITLYLKSRNEKYDQCKVGGCDI